MPKPQTPQRPPGHRFIYWLAKTAQRARMSAGVDEITVAQLAGFKNETTIKRFERAQHWPVDPEGLMAAYARVSGIEDPRDLYQQALKLWYEHGAAPQLDGKQPASADERFVQSIETGRTPAPKSPASAKRPSANGKKKAAGG